MRRVWRVPRHIACQPDRHFALSALAFCVNDEQAANERRLPMKGWISTVAGLLSLLSLLPGGTGAATGQDVYHGRFSLDGQRGSFSVAVAFPGFGKRSWDVVGSDFIPGLRSGQVRTVGRGPRAARRGGWSRKRAVRTPCRLRHPKRRAEAARRYQAQGSPRRHLRLDSHATRSPQARLRHAEFNLARVARFNLSPTTSPTA
jgi:hypothetical protein